MKLQIDGQQWRLRIDEDELQCLRKGGPLLSTSTLPGGLAFHFRLELATVEEACIGRNADNWIFTLPESPVGAYVERLPCRDGLDFILPAGRADATMRLIFEVDVRDSVRRRGAGSRKR